MNFEDLQVNDKVVITGYKNEQKNCYREKLLSMGLTKGTEIKVLKFAPLGDPVELQVRGFHLSLRKEEAKILKIKRVISNES